MGMAAAGSGDGRRAARLATVGIALCFRRWLGTQGCLRWRGPLALFSGLTVLCIGGNAVIRQILNMIK